MRQERGPASQLKAWSFEITSAVSAALLVAAIAGILFNYDRQPIFDGSVITLNAVVSTLSTVVRSCMLAALAGAISQWNWLMFSGRPRRLYDFDRVAEASRGPLGSVKLLFNRNVSGGNILRIGALVTVVCIALDPFAQQLVQYDQETRIIAAPPSQVTVPRADSYSRGNRLGRFGDIPTIENGRFESDFQRTFADADFAFQASTIFSINAPASAVSQQVSFRCPTGNCRYPSFDSLAVCSRCADITSMLERNQDSTGSQFFNLTKERSLAEARENSTEYTLPNGLYMNNMDQAGNNSATLDNLVFMTLLGTANRSRTVAMSEIDTLIWSQTVIRLGEEPSDSQNWPDLPVTAEECALYYCVRQYWSQVNNGTLVESSRELEDVRRASDSWQPLRSEWDEVSDHIKESLAFHPTLSMIDRSDLQLRRQGSSAAKRYNITQSAIDSISAFMQDTFSTCANTGDNCTEFSGMHLADESDWEPPNGFYIFGGEREQYGPSVAKVFWEAGSVEDTFASIARSMSNAIRNTADDETVQSGDEEVFVTVYVIVWPWIALHCLTVLLGLFFLGMTIRSVAAAETTVPVWKSSELAVLSQSSATWGILDGDESLGELESKAKDARVALLEGRGMTSSAAAAGRLQTWDTGYQTEIVTVPLPK